MATRARRDRGDGALSFDEHRGNWVGQIDLGRDQDGRRIRPKVIGRTRADRADEEVSEDGDPLKKCASRLSTRPPHHVVGPSPALTPCPEVGRLVARVRHCPTARAMFTHPPVRIPHLRQYPWGV